MPDNRPSAYWFKMIRMSGLEIGTLLFQRTVSDLAVHVDNLGSFNEAQDARGERKSGQLRAGVTPDLDHFSVLQPWRLSSLDFVIVGEF